MILASLGIIAGKGAIPMDVDAQAFITAASITDSTQKSAVNQLVLDLKSANIWTKMKAIYPFVGGTASSHRFNLKAPTTNTSDFYLTFTGGWTHSSTGVLPNGSDAYANTYLAPLTQLPQNDIHVSYYSRTNAGTLGVDFGTDSGVNVNKLYAYIKYTDSKTYFRVNRSTGAESSKTLTAGALFYMLNRSSSSTEDIFENTTKTTFTIASSGLSSNPIYLGAYNNGTPSIYGSKECAFSSIGYSLSDAEQLAFYNAVQAFNTTLSRQV